MDDKIYAEVSEDTVLFDAAEEAYMTGFADEVDGDVEAPIGHFFRVGNVIVTTNTLGFKDAFAFLYEDDAKEQFRLLSRGYYYWLNDGEGE